ncbi:variable surface protein Vir30, truncated, putative, partial [Plasmodium vivax]
YDFFKNIERYIKDGKSIEDIIPTVVPSSDCNSFSKIWGIKSGNEIMAKNICNILVSIYKYFKNGNDRYGFESNYKEDFTFLNYWVNWKIHEGMFNENTTVKDFYDYIGSHALSELNYDVSNTLIYDIDKDDLYKLNILYSLYEKYSKLNAITYDNLDQDKQSLYSHSTACCNDYNKAKYICNDDNKNNNS